MLDKIKELFKGKKQIQTPNNASVKLDINDVLGLYNAGNGGVSPVIGSDDYSAYITYVYEFNSIAASAINLLANTMTSIPLKYTIGEGENVKDITNDNSIEYINLLNNPCEDTTASLFRRTMYLNNLITGNSFIWTVRSLIDESITSWRNVAVQDVVLQVAGLNDVLAKVIGVEFTYQSKIVKAVPYADFIHIREPNLKSGFGDDKVFYGMPPLKPARQLIKASNETNNAAISAMTNNGASGILYLALDKMKDGLSGLISGNSDVELDRLSSKFKNKTAGSQNYNTVETTNMPIDYKEIGRSLKDLDVSDLQKSQMRMISNIFNLPTQLQNDPDSSTFANMSNAMIWLYTIAAIPRVKYANEFIVKYIREEYKEPTFNIVVDENSIPEIQNSILQSKAETVKDLDSWTINEQRAYTGQDEKEGEIYNTPIFLLKQQTQNDTESEAKNYIIDQAYKEFKSLTT